MDIFKNVGSILNGAAEILKSDAAKNVINAISNGSSNAGGFDIADGLKSALQVGIKTAAENLAKQDGFLGDVAVRIGLPAEAATTFSAVQSLSNNAMINNVLNATGVSIPDSNTIITLFNRAAENAAPKSIDVFVDAITAMSIGDAKNILFGADNAATEYLKTNTFTKLQGAFEPSITNSLNTIQVANTTPTAAWSVFADYNNKLVEMLDNKNVLSVIEMVRKLGLIKDEYMDVLKTVNTVNPNLSDYITGKALDGLFLKVSDKENDIRHNASARVNDVLKNVFGMLDNK